MSQVTDRLITLLLHRDEHGQKKYGTTLDRKDLSIEQWLQHLIEELLDGAGYAEAAKREVEALHKQRNDLREALNDLLGASLASDFNEHWDAYKNAERIYNETK